MAAVGAKEQIFAMSSLFFTFCMSGVTKKSILEEGAALFAGFTQLPPSAWYGRASAGTQGEEIAREWLGMCKFLACIVDGRMGGGLQLEPNTTV